MRQIEENSFCGNGQDNRREGAMRRRKRNNDKLWFSSSQQANNLGGRSCTDSRRNRNGQNSVNAICYFPGESEMDSNRCQAIRC